MTANIFDIQRASFVDGPGIRTTVFFKGCNLRCAWCHNPESQSPKTEMLFYKNRCTGCGKCKEKCKNALESCDFCGKCVLFCPHDAREICGREYSLNEVMREIVKDKETYENSGGGVTFSGGECMLQIDFLEEILKKCKEHGIHTAVDTAGCVAFDKFERIFEYTDMFLYDVKIVDSEKHKIYVGAPNEIILDNLKKLISRGKRIWVRVPIIEGINDSEDDILAIKALAAGAEKIELLPYHAMGEHKYSALGREATQFKAPSEERMNRIRALVSL